MPTILFTFLLAQLTLVSGSFSPETLPGNFRLLFGMTICPDIITFTQPGLQHPSTTLLFDTQPVSGGTLNLIPNPPTGGSGFIRHFSVNRQLVGNYFGGTLSSRIKWDSSALGVDTSFVFFTPERAFRTTWEDVIGANQPLQATSGVPVYWFEQGVDYIVINNRCLLRRDGGSAPVGTGGRGSASGGGSCFPAAAVATTPHGRVRVDQLSTGDYVWTGDQFSEIFAWTHRDSRANGYHYMTIVLSDGKKLTLTPGHYVYVDDVAIPASDVRPGNMMSTDSGKVTVVEILEKVYANGLYNPQTKHGDILVDGVRVTTYTTAVPPRIAHALLAPIRMAFDLCRFANRQTNMIM